MNYDGISSNDIFATKATVHDLTIRNLRHRLVVLEEAVRHLEEVAHGAITALEHCRQRPHIHNPVGAELDGLPTQCDVINLALMDLKTAVG